MYFLLIFFFNDTATTEIYTLSLHDALPISSWRPRLRPSSSAPGLRWTPRSPWPGPGMHIRGPGHGDRGVHRDRKSTRLNSSHSQISDAGFCLQKKKAACLLEDATPLIEGDR